ncbi:hypothetical protein BKI52_14025 [marine bacterium AO1-C]|nr:hypothetical protein BKI52_14025 [marine bacterium AO1-C]
MVLQKVKEGNKELLRKLEDQRHVFIYKNAKMFPYLQKDQISDAYSEAILILYANVKSGKLVELKASLEAYLFAIGRNLLRNESRKTSRFSPLEIDLADDENQVTEKQITEDKIVRDCLKKMGPRAQKVLSLLIFEGKSIAEVAQLMDFSNTRSASTAKHKYLTKLKRLCETEKLKYQCFA